MFKWYVSLALLVLALVALRSAKRRPDAPTYQLCLILTAAALLIGLGFSALILPESYFP